MAIFAITYDLNKNKDYPSLYDALDKLDSHKAAWSFYFVSADATAMELREYLAQHIDGDDRLIVCRVDHRPATRKALPGTKEWLDEHFN